jgi:hypothetical protein
MTQGLLVSRMTKLRLHKMAIQSPTEANVTSYKRYRNIYNGLIRVSRKWYFDDGLKNSKKDPKKTWKLINEALNRSSSNEKIEKVKVNDDTLTEPADISNAFNSFFINAGKNISNSVPPTNKRPEDFLPVINPPDFLLGQISQAEVVTLIRANKSKLSSDIDGLTMSLLKFVALEIGTPLAHIFNLSLNSGTFPELLKKSRIVPLHKQGPKDNCDNYRPIALLSTISKILEKFVATRLVNHMELNKLMSPNQFGFLRNKNTEQCLVLATNFISNALNNGEYCIGIFLDLKKAFDVCSHSILLKKLKHYGVRDVALKWFESYLSGRSQQVDVGGGPIPPS